MRQLKNIIQVIKNGLMRLEESEGGVLSHMKDFLSQIEKKGALVIGEPNEVAEKIKRHSEALGGLSRFTFQIDNPGLTNNDLMDSYELIGKKVIPLLNH